MSPESRSRPAALRMCVPSLLRLHLTNRPFLFLFHYYLFILARQPSVDLMGCRALSAYNPLFIYSCVHTCMRPQRLVFPGGLPGSGLLRVAWP